LAEGYDTGFVALAPGEPRRSADRHITMRRRSVLLFAALATLALGACGVRNAPESDVTVPPSVSLPPASSTAPTDVDPTVPVSTTTTEPVSITGVYDDVAAYPACGNEPLTHLGVTWYPVSRVGTGPIDGGLQPILDRILETDREDPTTFEAQGLMRVSPPGPGDDVGTLVVWADGVARWTSDSGNLDVWLVDQEIDYRWVC
jgi:hypothetical protein